MDKETGETLDDAQGYGYKTTQKAYAAWHINYVMISKEGSMIFIDKKIKKRYQMMSTFEDNDEYQNKLRYAYHSYIKRTIMSYIGLTNVFGFEFCLLILILQKKNALMISLTVAFIACSIVFTLLSDTAELDHSITSYLNNIARKNYKIIKNDNIKLFMEDDDTLCIIQNGYVVSKHKIKNSVDQYQVEVQEYLCIDSAGDISLRREYILTTLHQLKWL